jgi:hypothetical protein
MAEIRVDPVELQGLAAALTRVRDGLAEAPPPGGAAGCLGDRRLEEALHEVTANWSRERARLDELLAGVAAGAQRAAVRYAQVESAVVGACRAAGR